MFSGIEAKIIAYALAFVIVAAGVWRFAVYHEDIGYQRAVSKYEAKLSDAKAESLTKERELQAKVDSAEKNGAEREKQHKATVAILESRAIGLRHDIATFRAGLPKATAASCVESADAAADLLLQCSEEYQRVAKAADGHANDALTCNEAWPK